MKQIFYKLFENLKQLGIKPSIGSRTNVTPIPGSEIDRIINRPVAPKEFDYSKPEVVDSIRGIVKNASDYVGQFTERQAKTFNDNIERILNVIKPKETTADVVDLATKEKITGPGLESLMKEKGVASISRKTIEAETLIKQFLDDDLISLNAKQIDQLSRGKAEDVFENIFGSKAKELITGKNTNESLNEVYNKLKTTKDVKGRLPDDPSFDPSDIEFKEGGSVSEDVRQLLKEEFIKIINEDPEAYPDTNAGFRRFLKRKGAPVFNYKDGGEVEEKEEKDILEKFGTLYKRKKEKKDGKLGPTDPLSKYESYSEEELAGNIEAKKPTFDTLEDYIMETMPIFEPKDVAPPKSYSPMPVEKYLTRRLFIDLAEGGEVKSFEEKSLNKKGYETEGLSKKEIFDLYDSVMGTFSKRYKKGGVSSLFKKRKRYADGGVASMFRERPGYAEGGDIQNVIKEFEKEGTTPSSIVGPNGIEFKLVTGQFSGKPVYKAFYPKDYDFSKFGAIHGSTGSEFQPEYFFKHIMAPEGTYFDYEKNDFLPTVSTPEVPTVDPFSGQQVSAQDQSEFLDIPDQVKSYIASLSSAKDKQDVIDLYRRKPVSVDEIPTVDPFSGQQVSTQDLIDINKEMSAKAPPGGFSEEGLRKNADDDAGRLQSMMEAFNSGYYNNAPTVDPFSGQQVSAQDQMAFAQPQLNVGSADPLTNILGSQVGNLGYSEMNALRNNPNAFLENPFLQAARTGAQLLSPGKVISDIGENLSTIYHGTADPSKAFSGSKFFATPDYQTALQYAKEGALRGTSIGDTTGDILRATVPTSQVQDLLKRGLTGTREIVLDPQAAQKLFLQGSGDLVETGSLMSRLGRKAFQALPVVGAGLAGLDAYQRFGQGDYIGSALGAASAIPVLGLPATAAQVAYDIYNQSQNSPVVGFNQVQDPRTMMAYGGRVSMSNGGLTNTIPPARGPNSQGVESLFTRRYN